MRRYGHVSRAAFLPPAVWPLLGTGIFLLAMIVFANMKRIIPAGICLVGCAISGVMAAYFHTHVSICALMRRQIERRLFCPDYGNPLHLSEGTVLPKVKVHTADHQRFRVTVDASSCTTDGLERIPDAISSALSGKLADFAVVQCEQDIASNFVTFWIQDQRTSRQIIAKNIQDLLTDSMSIQIENGYSIPYRSLGSFLITGKTRSGKTSAIVSILLQVLYRGPDIFHSCVIIVDPKNAELSQLPYTISPDADGTAHRILSEIIYFDAVRIQRQEILNRACEECGHPVSWWELEMQPSFLVLDEWIALLGLFPARAAKDDPHYSKSEFLKYIQRVVTMGASAGCFVMLSSAEASVEAAGIPNMIRSAMGTRIMMRPNPRDGALLWSREKLEALPDRIYRAGDAWISSDDGVHDLPEFVQFPKLDFDSFCVLSEALARYHDDSDGA